MLARTLAILSSPEGIQLDTAEIEKLARLEDRNWWYKERRHLLSTMIDRSGAIGPALDIGAAGGGNTAALIKAGIDATALEQDETGVQICKHRGVPAVQGDARSLQFASQSFNLVIAFDVLEHIDNDVLAISEIHRVLRPGGWFFVAVPLDETLWSPHDTAVGHVRRYDKGDLLAKLRRSGFSIRDQGSWNVLLKPVVRARRRKISGSDLTDLPAWQNAMLSMIIRSERVLPVKRLPGVSMTVLAQRPTII